MKMMIKDFIKFLKKLITNNTGVSAKSFPVVVGTLIAAFSVINVILLIWVDAIFGLGVRADLIYALSVFVGAVEGVVAVLLGLKVWADNNEMVNDNKEAEEPNV